MISSLYTFKNIKSKNPISFKLQILYLSIYRKQRINMISSSYTFKNMAMLDNIVGNQVYDCIFEDITNNK